MTGIGVPVRCIGAGRGDARRSDARRVDARRVDARFFFALCACALLGGCVFGYGHCLLTEPVKNSLTGKLHFRSYPAAEGIDYTPVLALDRTEYVYAPAQSISCLAVNDVQLAGLAEFPPNIVENSHITVRGTLAQGDAGRVHTRFVLNVIDIEPVTPIRPAAPNPPTPSTPRTPP